MTSKIELSLKRFVDILLSLIGLVLLVVPFVLISLSIKLNSKGPVFFRQERVGKDGRSFKVWKFRTMVEGAVHKGHGYSVVKNDPRITRAGKILRDWGLDELPQLINVFKGEMSLVGPRPALRYQVEQYTDFQRERLQMRPGITGWALVHGRRKLSWQDRIRYDVWYTDNWSLLLDLKILLRTLHKVLIVRDGLYSPILHDEFGNADTPNTEEGEKNEHPDT